METGIICISRKGDFLNTVNTTIPLLRKRKEARSWLWQISETWHFAHC